MFGYVKIYKPELKVLEYEKYKAVYCSLCKKSGKLYGHLIRMTLSYDFTFLAALLLSVNCDNVSFKKGKCIYNPLKKCSFTCDCSSADEIYNYVSAVAVIMLYFKCCDDLRDGKKIKALLLKAIIKRKYKKATLKYPQLCAIMKEMNNAQVLIEASAPNIDAAADPTAVALAKIFENAVGESKKRICYRIGYCVGKWVYMADALDDLEADVRSNNFNPLKNVNLNDVVANLNVCSNEAGASFELLDNNQFSNIIKNILYLGMPNEIKRIINRKEEKQ